MVSAVTSAGYRWSVFSRFIAASLGGYAVVTLLHLALTVVLPWERHKALLFASQTGYLWWTAIIVWCFAARSATRVWLGLGIVALPLLLIDGWHLFMRVAP